MRFAAIFGAISFLSCGAAVAQTHVDDEHHIATGNAFGIPSDPYFARTPYTIVWKAEKSSQLYEQNGKAVRLEEVTVRVYDVVTKDLIADSGWQPLKGEMKVPVGGNHHIRVYAPGKWTANFKEDKDLLQLAASRGELKDGVTVHDAGKSSLRTKKERIESEKNATLQLIMASRERLGDAGVAALTADAHRAAQLASDEKDFGDRFGALSKVTFERIRNDGQQGSPGTLTESKPAPSVAPGSNWTGKGLPPGMQRR